MFTWRYITFLAVCIAAALSPLLRTEPSIVVTDNIKWPEQFEGRPLKKLELSEIEERFAAKLPGQVARFTDGTREIIFKSVNRATRQLHPASQCFEAHGHKLTPLPIRVDASGKSWSGFLVEKENRSLRVYECVQSPAGEQWPDVSAWYWAALLGKTEGPWLSIIVAENVEHENKVKTIINKQGALGGRPYVNQI